jgi:hypothetical protein
MQDLLGGQHLVAFDTMPASAPYVRSGKAARAGHVERRAAAGVPGRADGAGGRARGLPGDDLVWRLRAGRHAARDREPAARRSRQAMQTPDVKAKLEGIGADGTVSPRQPNLRCWCVPTPRATRRS